MEAEAYTYTAGTIGEQFFLKIKNEGILTAAHCEKCNINFLPVRGFCIFCGEEVNKLVNVEMPGKIESYTFAKLNSESKEEVEEKIIAYISFPNVKGGLFHKINLPSGKGIKIGLKVKPVFKEAKERKGTLNDIEYFEIIDS